MKQDNWLNWKSHVNSLLTHDSIAIVLIFELRIWNLATSPLVRKPIISNPFRCPCSKFRPWHSISLIHCPRALKPSTIDRATSSYSKTSIITIGLSLTIFEIWAFKIWPQISAKLPTPHFALSPPLRRSIAKHYISKSRIGTVFAFGRRSLQSSWEKSSSYVTAFETSIVDNSR